MFFRCLILIFIVLYVNGLAIPKQESKRAHDHLLSDEEHYRENEEHNVEYDHEAFLGETDAKTFDELSPEESKVRLGKIVDKIDADKNGYVTLIELRDWIQFSQRRYIVEDAERQWKALNHNDSPTLEWDHYKRLTYGYVDGTDDSDNFQYKDMVERDLRRWKKADTDGDGKLDKEQFINFVHPEEAEHMKDIVVLETMEDIDKDKDGKVSLEEYIGDMYGDSDLEEEPSWLANERTQFSQYRDRNKDGYLDVEEVKKWILPDDYDNSEAEAKHLVYESDINRDNQLSKDEILDKYDLFVGSQVTDFGEALIRHDEF